MKKPVTFCRVVHINALRCSVVVMCGDLYGTSLRRKYDAEMRRVKAPKDAPTFDEQVKGLEEEKRSRRGLTRVDLDYGDTTIHLNDWDSGVFVHEAYHAACGVMRARGIEDPSTELGAYLVEYLFNEIVNTDWTDRNFVKRNVSSPSGAECVHNKKGKKR